VWVGVEIEVMEDREDAELEVVKPPVRRLELVEWAEDQDVTRPELELEGRRVFGEGVIGGPFE
jgi:hypothetical protein